MTDDGIVPMMLFDAAPCAVCEQPMRAGETAFNYESEGPIGAWCRACQDDGAAATENLWRHEGET